LTFDRPVVAATSTTIASGVGTVSGVPLFVRNTATVQLSGVADRQTITLELDNIVGATGTTAKAFVAMSVLALVKQKSISSLLDLRGRSALGLLECFRSDCRSWLDWC
jgi:hypothetical protein